MFYINVALQFLSGCLERLDFWDPSPEEAKELLQFAADSDSKSVKVTTWCDCQSTIVPSCTCCDESRRLVQQGDKKRTALGWLFVELNELEKLLAKAVGFEKKFPRAHARGDLPDLGGFRSELHLRQAIGGLRRDVQKALVEGGSYLQFSAMPEGKLRVEKRYPPRRFVVAPPGHRHWGECLARMQYLAGYRHRESCPLFREWIHPRVGSYSDTLVAFAWLRQRALRCHAAPVEAEPAGDLAERQVCHRVMPGDPVSYDPEIVRGSMLEFGVIRRGTSAAEAREEYRDISEPFLFRKDGKFGTARSMEHIPDGGEFVKELDEELEDNLEENFPNWEVI